MIETSLIAWVFMTALIAWATLAGVSLSRTVPWSDDARRARVPLAFAFAAAPFLAGFSVILSLMVFPGAGHGRHLAATFAFLAAAGAVAFFLRHRGAGTTEQARNESGTKWNWVFGGLLALWAAGLVGETLFVPLTDNDALEYATVGRLLFELRTLQAYPALDPAAGSSGFFGPWSHPPLYTALLYLAELAQGHADAPGLGRLISPWFALSATALVYALARMAATRAGALAAALVFLSTPLFYMSAASAQIDAPAVAGMLLVFCSVVATAGAALRLGTVQGLLLGIALWTHSEAVLFVPLSLVAVAAFRGVRRASEGVKQIVVLLAVALAVAAWPYARNLALLGAVISDNPAVFALKKLGWAEYFSLSRGLGSFWDRIQYGLFKGWFAVESFSVSFWLMTLGVTSSFVPWLRQRAPRPAPWRLAAVAVVLCFLGGTVASMLIGTDQMIRNGRYLLVLLPCVALLAGTAISDWTRRPGVVARAALLSLCLFLLAQFLVIGTHMWRHYGIRPAEIAATHEAKLARWTAYAAAAHLKTNAPADAVVLSLQPADMYYSGRRMMSYLDPRLLPFYAEDDADRAWQTLRDIGVTHVHLRNRSFPPLYNSTLETILAREDLARLDFSVGGYQIYTLRKSERAAASAGIDLTPGSAPWTSSCRLAIGGETGILKFPVSSCAFGGAFFRRNVSHGQASAPESARLRGDAEYRLDLQLEGHAFLQVYLVQYGNDGSVLDQSLMGETLAGPTAAKFFQRRFRTLPETASVSVSVEEQGAEPVSILKAGITPLTEGSAR